jgi:alginate O-acetyltransferase complex protein AlgI
MTFNSIEFAIFFIVLTSLYFVLPHRYRWLLLLAGSCYFYMAFVPVYILILGFTIVVDYFAGILIENEHTSKRKLFLIASIAANIGVLAMFKYYNFLDRNLSLLLHTTGHINPFPLLSIILPIGLSFHTFQAMSYTIEVYRGHQTAERHFGIYALYVMFYPQLVAGPIERPQNLIHQFYEKHEFDYKRVTDGLKLMLWGLFKKVVIADRLAIIVDNVYDHPTNFTGLSLIIATVFFAFQIFCDFSGYSDIAIGAAKVMGFKLMTNFNRPYHAKSMSEFWKRWHISLSTWFRDYLYISLGGNRVSIPRWYLNLFIVFLISGLWHGANWTFIIWGALHGFYMVFGIITQKSRDNAINFIGINKFPLLNNGIQMLTTFMLVTFAWVFFRANSVNEAIYVIKNAIFGLPNDVRYFIHHHTLNLNLGLYQVSLTTAVLLLVFLESAHFIQKHHHTMVDWINSKPVFLRWSIYYILIFIIILKGLHTDKQFIYFQF